LTVLLAVGALLALPASASATTFTVNAFLDTASDGGCDADCTLRDAVTTADGSDVIELPPGTHSITLPGAPEDANASGDIDANSGDGPLVIRGTGASPAAVTIDATGLGQRVFDLSAGADFLIENLTITGGSDTEGGGIRNIGPELTLSNVVLTGNVADEGGAILNGGAATAGSRLTILGSTLSLNRTVDSPGGGAISNQNDARLTIAGSVLRDNRAETADGRGGAIFNEDAASATILASQVRGNESFGDDFVDGGGGVYTQEESSMTVTGSVIEDNISHNGGGGIFANNNTVLNVIETTVSNNNADEPAAERGGGGIFAGNDSAVTVLRSTVSGNSAAGIGGGGIMRDNDGELDLLSSTVSGNTTSEFGGGIRFETGSGGRSSIVSSTITGNSASSSGDGIFNDNDPGLVEPVILRGTIVNGGCDAVGGATALSSDGFNLDSGTGCGFGPGNGDLENADPLLGPLADNGGPTFTHLPGISGDAVDAGRANGFLTDQRGLNRTVNQTAIPNAAGSDGTDIGAAELAFQNIRCGGRLATMLGTPGVDSINGTGATDVIVALGGNDLVEAGAGKDIVCGGAGNDRIFGEAGDDTLFGDGGRDKLFGGPGRDLLQGLGGRRDICRGGGGRDRKPSTGCEKRIRLP
jgi:hypothetical protein